MKFRVRDSEENETKELSDYASKIRSGVIKIAREKNIDLSINNIEYSLGKTPLESSNDFIYDREKFNIDKELDGFLRDLNK